MKNKLKKGFTIVELVIVIAVIGILSAVLIPTFSGLIKSSKVSADQVVVRNLNTVLETEELNNNVAHTMQQVIDICSEHGYVPSRLVPSKDGYKIAWNQETRRFSLVSEADEVVQAAESAKKTTNWIVSKTYVKDGYSIYLADGYQGPTELTDVNTGIDVGKNTNITKIVYTRPVNETAQVAIINTGKGSNLDVVAPTDTVNHWGHLYNLTINGCSTEQGQGYFEYGTLDGRFSAPAEVSGNIVITAQAQLNEVKIEGSVNVSFQAGSKVETLVVDSAEAHLSVSTGAEVNTVVAEVEVPGIPEEKVVAKTEVSTEAELTAALLDASAKYIAVKSDFDITSPIMVARDVIIDGENHTITSKATVQANKRGIRISENDVKLELKNLTLDVRSSVTSDGGYPRGLQVDSNKTGVVIDVNNCNISATHYAFNVCNGADITASFTDSHLTGYGALNLWAANYTVKANNCVLEGINGTTREQFGVVVLEGDVTGLTEDHSSFINVEISNCELIARVGNSSIQNMVLYNTGATANNVKLDNCTFTPVTSGNGSVKLYLNSGTNNTLYVNDEQVMKTITVKNANFEINEDGKTAVGSVDFSVDGKIVSYNLSSATLSDWGDGTDYLFNYTVNGITYVLDLDISTKYYANGYTLYIQCLLP